ncbi:MAG: DegT/DnrJ/EryC1/StrS family aminotransferase [Candidatus Omnitrophica bacterium]|nr:DegT/DnrJ/EryC1/StrS family aminotransferase [Candidatus Omnitrophota bacterium]
MSDHIPLIDLAIQYRAIKPEIDRAIQRVLDRGQFVLGPEVEALEREVASYCGVRYAVAVASGTDALELALRAAGIGPGDEVITTAFSFFATAEAILNVGASCVFVDIDPTSYTLDPRQVKAKLSPRTKALLPVHLYGHPCRMGALMRIARAHRLMVIEDCAQALGARDHGKRVGSFGQAGCVSFYPSKNLGAYGEGGMVVTRDAKLAERIRLLRNHGSRARYQHRLVGANSRLDELQAAILRVKLRHLDRWNDARRSRARRYAEAFQRHVVPGVVLPHERPACEAVYHLYSIRMRNRDRVQRRLAAQGIATQVAYPSTIPAQPALAPMGYGRERYPVAEAVARDILALPIYPELSAEQIEYVVKQIAQVLNK